MLLKSVPEQLDEMFGNHDLAAKGGPTSTSGGNLRSSDPESSSTPSSNVGPTTDATAKGGPTSTSGGNLKEADTVGSGFKPTTDTPFGPKFRYYFKKHRNKIAVGGGIGGITAGLLIAAFLALLPLKIQNMITGLENHFDSSTNSALQGEIHTMLKDYIEVHILPGYKTCGVDTSRHCQVNFTTGSNPVTALYKTWDQARIENKLANNYGLEFRYNSTQKEWHLITRTTSPEGINIGADAEGGADGQLIDNVFNNELEFGAAADQAIKDTTSWNQVYLRYKYRKLLGEKYGTVDCIFFCGIRRSISSAIKDKTKSAQLIIVQRVILPRSTNLGVVLKCLFQGGDCTPTNTQPNGDTGDLEADGAAADQSVDVPISDGMRQLAKSYKITDEAAIQALQQTVNDISEKGFQKWLITEGLVKIGIQQGTAEATANAIPIIGWANMAAQLIHGGNNAGPTLKKLRYVVNTTAAVGLFSVYETYANEIHTGHVTAAEVGSMNDTLSSGNHGSTNDPEIGGTAGATQTPLYQYLNNGSQPTSSSGGTTSTSFLSNLADPFAYADASNPSTTTASTYLCANGKPVPQGQLVCPEEQVGGGNSYANTLHEILNLPGINVITTIANIWEDTVGKIFNFASDIIGGVFSGVASGADHTCSATGGALPPGYCQAKDLISSGFKYIVNDVTQFLIPDPFSSNMSGGRTYDMMALGADSANSSSAQDVLGGRALTTQQAAVIYGQQYNQALHQFDQQSWYNRMFATDSQFSFVSRIADDMPFTGSSVYSSIFSTISNPFTSLFHGVSTIFDGKVSAATFNQPDPFGVTQYGYTQADLNAIGDPETYWNNHCTNNATNGFQPNNDYNIAGEATDPNTGMPYNTQTDPCRLIMAAVSSAGALFNSSLLTPDELSGLGITTSSSSPVSTGNYENPFRDIINLVPQRIDQGVDYDGTGPIYAIGDGVVNGVYPNWCTPSMGGCTGDEPFVAYTLSSGPAAGKTVYVAECITPKVVQGEVVTTNTVIAQMIDCGNGIETGWANTSNLPDSMALQCWDQVSSAFGVNFSQLLQSLGAKPGVTQEANPPCTLPTGWPQWS